MDDKVRRWIEIDRTVDIVTVHLWSEVILELVWRVHKGHAELAAERRSIIRRRSRFGQGLRELHRAPFEKYKLWRLL